MRKILLLIIYSFCCILPLNAQFHNTIVPALAKYDGIDIEENMNRLLNEVISLDFSEHKLSSTVYSIKTAIRDTTWIRKVKNPLKAKKGRDFIVGDYRTAKVEDLQDKEFLVKSIDRDIVGQYQRSFYSVLTLENILDAKDIYTWRVQTSSNYTNVFNEKIRIRSKLWNKIANEYVCDGRFYYYLSPTYAKPSKENGYTEYVKIHYVGCDFFLGGDFFSGMYISKYKDEEGHDYILDEYTMKQDEFPITEEEYNKIVATNIANHKLAGNYYYTLSKVIKPSNKSIRYGKIEERQSDSYFYEDNVISIFIVGGSKQFEFSLTNKMTNSIKIIWDEASFVDADNLVSKVVHKGVRFIDATNSLPATTIPSGASISELIAPTNRIKYSDGWYQQSIISSNKSDDPNVVGKTVKILLPIEVNGVVNEYVFCFTIGWKFTYPEYQN